MKEAHLHPGGGVTDEPYAYSNFEPYEKYIAILTQIVHMIMSRILC